MLFRPLKKYFQKEQSAVPELAVHETYFIVR